MERKGADTTALSATSSPWRSRNSKWIVRAGGTLSFWKRVLAEILRQNAHTEYLQQRCGLGGSTDRQTFKAKVPMVTYDDLKPVILRIANGDRFPILSAHPISEFLTCHAYPFTSPFLFVLREREGGEAMRDSDTYLLGVPPSAAKEAGEGADDDRATLRPTAKPEVEELELGSVQVQQDRALVWEEVDRVQSRGLELQSEAARVQSAGIDQGASGFSKVYSKRMDSDSDQQVRG
ncbi:hypothetical protein EJ110_NYTH01181 [Nymphaea thermarum]|nr:hypothetical protein EJ110_NYTH01181 [Nymphaea thermarum]